MRSKSFRTVLLVEILLFTALVTGLTIVSYNAYLDRARKTYQAGITAFEDGDYLTAYRRFQEIADRYRFSNLPEIADYPSRMTQSSLLIYAQFSQYQQQLDTAIQALETFLASYPASPVITVIQKNLARLYLQKADQLRRFSNYPAALQIYQQIGQRFPQTILDSVIEADISALFLAWGDELRANGDLQRSIEKYTVILDSYPQTPSLQGAITGILTATREWRQSQLNSGEYEAILQDDLFLLGKYAQNPYAAEYLKLIAEDIPITYDQWADSLCAKGEYEAGLKTYMLLMTQYPDHPLTPPAHGKLIRCYADWADQQRQTGEYEAALDTLTQAVDSCQPALCDEETVNRLQENLAQIYLEWGNQVRSAGDLDSAARYYEIILAGYGHTPAAAQAMEAWTRLSLEKSQALIDKGSWYDAWKILLDIHHRLSRYSFPLSSELETQRNAVQTALQETLLVDSGSDGAALMEEGLRNACTGLPVTALRFPFGIVFARGGVCDSAFPLPDDLQAVSPGQLRYAVLRTETLQTVQICRYRNDVKITRQQRLWKIEVFSLITGKMVKKLTFLGDPPPPCPSQSNLPVQDQTYIGEPPNLNEITFWLRSVFK